MQHRWKETTTYVEGWQVTCPPLLVTHLFKSRALWTLFPLLLMQSADRTQPLTLSLLQLEANPVALRSFPAAATARLAKKATVRAKKKERIAGDGDDCVSVSACYIYSQNLAKLQIPVASPFSAPTQTHRKTVKDCPTYLFHNLQKKLAQNFQCNIQYSWDQKDLIF